MERNEKLYTYITGLCKSAKLAESSVANSGTETRNSVLRSISEMLRSGKEEILKANKTDLVNADANGVPHTMLDRLKLDEKRIDGIAGALCELADMKDVLGVGNVWRRPNGLEIMCVKVPLGVVAMIYESRPNVTIDAAALCIKTGNAVILRGGKEAINTHRVFVKIIKTALEKEGISPDAVQLVDDISREGTAYLMEMREYVDVLIPRGGKGLIKSVVDNSKIPVIETGAGNCHVYIDCDADLDMAVNIAATAKMSRPSVCNSAETLLVHEAVAEKVLPAFYNATREHDVEIRGCEKTRTILKDAKEATDEDYYTEYNDYIMSVKVVGDVREAVEHINKYNTKHSEAIITDNIATADYFKKHVDASSVYVNASTRFTDGEEFGFGAEIGISTQKLHARGPMGLEALTTVKYLITGNGQTR